MKAKLHLSKETVEVLNSFQMNAVGGDDPVVETYTCTHGYHCTFTQLSNYLECDTVNICPVVSGHALCPEYHTDDCQILPALTEVDCKIQFTDICDF